MLRKLFSRLRPKPIEVLPGNRKERFEYRRKRALKLHQSGMKPKDIAVELGIAQSTVYTYL